MQDDHRRGITRLDIGWRAAEVLVSPRTRPLPRWVDPVVLLLLAGFLVLGTGGAPFGRGEPAQLALIRDAAVLVDHPAELVPGGAVSAGQEQLRLAHGAFSRYAAAAGWYAAGGRAADLPAVPGLVIPGLPGDRVPLELDGTASADPVHRLLVAARTVPAFLAAVAAVPLYLFVRRAAGRRVALVAVLLLMLHPGTVLAGRVLGDAGIMLTLGLGALAVAVGISARLGEDKAPAAGAWTGLAVLTGLTLAAGPGAAPLVAGVVAWVLAGIGQAVLRRRANRPAAAPRHPDGTLRTPGALAATCLGTVLVWVAVTPPLWGWLPQRLASRARDRAELIGLGALPGPGDASPGHALRTLVAGPFLDPPEDTGRWPGVPLGGVLAPVGVLLTVAAATALLLLVRLAVSGRRPAPVLGPERGWLPITERHVGRRDAAALAAWAGLTALWYLWHPSDLPQDRLPLLAVGSLLAALGVVVAVRWATVRWREIGGRLVRRRSAAADELRDDGGGQSHQWQAAPRVRRTADQEQPRYR